MRSLWAILAVLLSTQAWGQTSVKQSGTVTARHGACWTAQGVIQDCGTAASPLQTSIGTLGEGPTICATSSPVTGAFNQLCLAVNLNSNAQITLQNYGPATAQGLDFVINGTTVSLPTGGGTFVTTTSPTVVTAVPAFSSTGGVLGDSGLRASSAAITTGAWRGTPVAVLYGGCGANNAADCRTNIGLGSIATQAASAVAITGGTITGMPTPTAASDVAIKSYVDATSAGLTVLSPSRLASAAVLPNTPTYSNGASGVGATLTAGSNSTLTVDGTVAALNDIVLVKDQTSTTGCTVANAGCQNGIYYVSTAGSGAAPWVLTRCSAAACGTQFNTAGTMLVGSYTFVTAGAVNIVTSWVLSATVTTVGTTPVTFYQFSNLSASVTSFGGATGAITVGNGLTMSSTTVNSLWTATGNNIANNNTATGSLTLNTDVGRVTSSGLTTDQPVMLFLDQNSSSGFGWGLQFFAKDTLGAQRIGSAIAGGMLDNTAAATIGHLTFVTNNASAAIQTCMTMSSQDSNYPGLRPCTDFIYSIGSEALQWKFVGSLRTKMTAGDTSKGAWIQETSADRGRAIYTTTAASDGIGFLGLTSGNVAELTGAGVWANASDRSYKQNIHSLRKYGLQTVLDMRPREYEMRSDGASQVGFIGDEMKELVPEVTSTTDGKISISYGSLVPILARAIQEQQREIDGLKRRLN